MSIFTRFKDIVNANINYLLDKAEDPEKMIRLMINEMEATLVELKSNCAEQISLQMRTQRDLSDIEKQAGRWEARAKLAAEKSNDNLAKEALIQFNNCTAKLDLLKEDIKVFDSGVRELKVQIGKLQNKLDEIRNKRLQLVQRAKTAYNLKHSNNILHSEAINSINNFYELEGKIERSAAAYTANEQNFRSKEEEFLEMEMNEKLEKQLQELKAKQAKTK